MQVNEELAEESGNWRQKYLSYKSSIEDSKPEMIDAASQAMLQPHAEDANANDDVYEDSNLMNKADEHLDDLHESTISVMSVREKILTIMNDRAINVAADKDCTSIVHDSEDQSSLLDERLSSAAKITVLEEQINLRNKSTQFKRVILP